MSNGIEGSSVACVVLAAGAGSRFGAPKGAARLPSGQRFLDVVVEHAAAAGLAPVVAIILPGVAVPPPAWPVVAGWPPGEQIASVRLGLLRLEATAAVATLIWPVDHPFATAASARAICERFLRSRSPVVVPVMNGRRGHPVLFAREAWTRLLAEGDGRGGARAVVQSYGDRVEEVMVHDAGVLRDVDTPADLEQPSAEGT